MVANAGITMFKPLVESVFLRCLFSLAFSHILSSTASVEDWEKVHSINALGVMLCFKYAAIQMIKQGRGGRIIGASSGSGKQGSCLSLIRHVYLRLSRSGRYPEHGRVQCIQVRRKRLDPVNW